MMVKSYPCHLFLISTQNSATTWDYGGVLLERQKMDNTRYTKDHEWIRIDGDTALVGITNYAQEQLGDVVFVELPGIGTVLNVGDEAAVVESVKAASEVYAPTSGEVRSVNEELTENPALVNEDAEGQGKPVISPGR